MKGINVRKVAAFAGAAVLGLSAVSFADVWAMNTQVVDQNGQPTVKIYVGSQAAISDGVAAANIAAKIANEAYKSSTLTASTSGAATCSVGSGTGTSGSCSILESSKSVTLEVMLPGEIAGTHTFKTLITDTVDKTLANRISTRDEDMYVALKSSSDTSGTYTSPLRGYNENATVAKNLYRIGAGQFSGFADYSVVDSQATSGGTYTEEQAFWVGTTNDAVKYDTDSSIRDIAVNTFSAMVYSAKFAGNDFGIPVCTGDLNSNATDDWTTCDINGNSMTERHRVKVKFMGSEWVISELRSPGVLNPSSTAVVTGGQLKLAKEAKYGTINVGGQLDAGTFKVRLADISVNVGSDNKHPAIIDLLDANDAVVGQFQVDPGTTFTTPSVGGQSVKIHVYKTAPGFTLNAKWAEMAIFADEVTLKDGKAFNLVSSTDPNKNYKVSLLWKNRDYSGGSTTNNSDSLREIVVYDVDTFVGQKYKAGDVYNFLKSAPTFKVTYNGLDLTDDDYVPVTISALSKTNNLRVATVTGGDAACATSSTGDMSYTAKFIQVKTDGNLFGGSGLMGSYQVDKFYIDPIGITTSNSTTPNGTQVFANASSYLSATGTGYSPKIFFQPSGQDCWKWVIMTAQALGPSDVTNAVRFDTAGDNSAAYGAIYLNTTSSVATGFGGFVVLQEDAGKNDTVSNNKIQLAVPFNLTVTSGSDDPFRFKSDNSATAYVWYRGLRDSTLGSKEIVFVTERGTRAVSMGTTDATYRVAKKIGMPTFQFAYSDTAVSTSGEEYVMKVGDSKVFGGVTVKVKAIDASSGSCSVLGPNGAPACSVDSTGVMAVISPNNAPSVEVSEPYKLSSSLVMMDSAGPSAGVAILVGGPEVNMMTKAALEGSNVDFNVDTVVVKEIGNKIVVAGKTASDTMAAADQFIAGVKRQ